jgi:hypothetical protein
MSSPSLYLTLTSQNTDIIQESMELIRGTKYYYQFFDDNTSFNHLIELTTDSCNNEFIAYTFSAGDDIIYKKEKREWSSSIMSADSTLHANKMRTVVDTLNDFHSDSSVTEKNKKIHIKYNNKVYHTDKNIPLFGKRYYVLDDVTNATPAPVLPASITIN